MNRKDGGMQRLDARVDGNDMLLKDEVTVTVTPVCSSCGVPTAHKKTDSKTGKTIWLCADCRAKRKGV